MPETKKYKINDVEFELRTKFTLDDMDRSDVIQSFYGLIDVESNEKFVAPKITKEQLIDLVWAVLISADGKNYDKDFFKTTDQFTAQEIIADFFLVFIELKLNTFLLSMNSMQKLRNYTEALKSSKIN